ncbi:MAG: FecR domain-containing protein, partial [Planctomycetales bacterium]|nr:FecR domain-containing protein [Planctomycetales bacterium]
MDNIEVLIERYIDDRDDLTDMEYDALVEAISGDAQLAARVKDQLLIDEALAQQLAVDRGDFIAQVQQRLRDEQSGVDAPLADEDAAAVAQMGDLIGQQLDLTRRRIVARRRRQRWLAAVTVLALLGAAAAIAWRTTRPQPIAAVESIEGSPTILRSGRTILLSAQLPLLAGDRLETLPGDEISVRFLDDSRLQVFADTSLQLQAGGPNQSKKLHVAWGSLLARVAPQAAGRPLSLATPLAKVVVGSAELWLTAQRDRTQIDVIDGAVEVARPSDASPSIVGAGQFALATSDALSIKPLAWPVDRRDLVVLLEAGQGDALVRQSLDKLAPAPVQSRGRARQTHDLSWSLDQGALVLPEAANRALLAACGASGELTIEAIITPRSAAAVGPARIVTFSTDSSSYNFTLGQVDDRLILRLDTDGGSGRSDTELCRLAIGQPQHVAVAYRSGELACYLNGQRVLRQGSVQGGFASWPPQPLLIGGEHQGDRDWAGVVDGVAVYDRFLDPLPLARNARQALLELSAHPRVPQVEIVGELLHKSVAPTLEDIAPQRSALVVSRYRVVSVTTGVLDDANVLIAEGAWLSGEPQPAIERAIGERRVMTLERLGLNAQLETTPRFDEFN